MYQEERTEGNGLGGEQTRRQGGVHAGGSLGTGIPKEVLSTNTRVWDIGIFLSILISQRESVLPIFSHTLV